jgi:uncharacterized lipoprotein NlpE involved in copper resistance
MKIIKLRFKKSIIALLSLLLILISGCGCENTHQDNEQKQSSGNVLVPDFKGPDSVPFSKGPDGPPPE